MIRIFLSSFAVLVTIMIFFSKNVFNSFLYRTSLSVLMVAIYAVYFAPDVAITEAMLGALLATFIYLLSFKIHSKLRVAIVKIPVIAQKYQDSYIGIVPSIMDDFSKLYNHKIEYLEVEDIEKCKELAQSGEVDLAISFDGDFKILSIPYYNVNGVEMSYFELLELGENSNVHKSSNKILYFTFPDKNSIVYLEFQDFYNQEYINNVLKRYKLGGI
ncbi:hypothetical protein SU69_09020 [Thermosipho melanesiensis]|uniref:MrpA C-terminal/MbhD domain-containing protein n=2 Tax=Thermosipho melanesiensis TaxID=46541 RepID=A6LNX0_THEM4|nr:hydrogenase subunit MbhD domain-containing protein [Thermosipho melanesiensis]ABR31621.1 hypothetical protein Tmel_1786 [Thermosipho melanesiensis BI429]APT74650.1 hypothetical protein BW47_09400 [Thermosipho melanesiensis]OOC35149.1 hypothetical protein SU69_09020 [Thermosipho melanesiensis]OOC35359.1 hypothetical protein SU70_09030 [Thermosipho melanesiensis]OOC36610.1 hypothetical protein SU68_09090 [Thermosipho melanesiensis]